MRYQIKLNYKTNKAAQELGKLGGEATAKKHGKKHFSDAGKKGMAKRWANEPTPKRKVKGK